MSEDGADEDGVLDPDDLDVRNDERVVELDENRFFVSLSDDGPTEPSDLETATGASRPGDGSESPVDRPTAPTDGATTPGTDRANPDSDRSATSRPGEPPLREALAAADGTYAIAATVRTDRGTAEHVIGTNNVAETFEAFCRWYAAQVGDGQTPPEEVLRILARESDLEL